MFSLVSRMGLFVPLVLAVVVSCTPLDTTQDKSPLDPTWMSSDSVVLDLFFVRFPFGDSQINGPLWHEIDEQHFPVELRRRLAQAGFRVGLVGGQLPVKLSELLELKDKPPPTGETNTIEIAEMDSDPRVLRSHKQLRAGKGTMIAASDIYDELPLLMCESGGVCGRTYPKAQGMLILRAFPEKDGRVRLELVPELHYGDVRQRYVGAQGAWRLDTGRSRRVFDDMTISATLTAGHMLVFSSLPNRPGSLGHHFFTCNSSDKRQQKLLVIRLSQTQHDDLFAPTEVLALDQLEE